MQVLVTQLCLTLCDPMGCSLPGSSVHRIIQEEYWSGLPFPSPGDLPDPGIEPTSPALQADSLLSEPPGKPKVMFYIILMHISHFMFFVNDLLRAVYFRLGK